MKFKEIALLGLLFGQVFSIVSAQEKAPSQPPRGEPPAQAYEDCKGRKVGDAIQHSTPEGKVAATCQESSKGLVARPKQPKGTPQASVGK